MITAIAVYLLLRWFIVPDRAAGIIITITGLADALIFVVVVDALRGIR